MIFTFTGYSSYKQNLTHDITITLILLFPTILYFLFLLSYCMFPKKGNPLKLISKDKMANSTFLQLFVKNIHLTNQKGTVLKEVGGGVGQYMKLKNLQQSPLVSLFMYKLPFSWRIKKTKYRKKLNLKTVAVKKVKTIFVVEMFEGNFKVIANSNQSHIGSKSLYLPFLQSCLKPLTPFLFVS